MNRAMLKTPCFRGKMKKKSVQKIIDNITHGMPRCDSKGAVYEYTG